MSTDRMSIKDSAGRDPLLGLQDAICNAAFDYLENHCPDIEEGRESAEWIAEALRIAAFRAGLDDGHQYLVCIKVDDSEVDSFPCNEQEEADRAADYAAEEARAAGGHDIKYY